MSFIQICLVQTFGHQPSVGPGEVFIWSYSLPASGTSQHQFRVLAKKVGPQWTNMDQRGPRRSNLQRLLIVRSVHSVQSSPRPPPKKLPCSRWSALKIILVIVIVVFSFFNDNLNRYDLETFEHLRSSPGLPCNVPSAGSRFASCLYVHTWPSTLRLGKRQNQLKSN